MGGCALAGLRFVSVVVLLFLSADASSGTGTEEALLQYSSRHKVLERRMLKGHHPKGVGHHQTAQAPSAAAAPAAGSGAVEEGRGKTKMEQGASAPAGAAAGAKSKEKGAGQGRGSGKVGQEVGGIDSPLVHHSTLPGDKKSPQSKTLGAPTGHRVQQPKSGIVATNPALALEDHGNPNLGTVLTTPIGNISGIRVPQNPPVEKPQGGVIVLKNPAPKLTVVKTPKGVAVKLPPQVDVRPIPVQVDAPEQPLAAVGPRGSGFWSTKGSQFVDAGGRLVAFSGVTWAGFESPNMVVHGLWQRYWGGHLAQMKILGLNVIKLPFAGDTITGKPLHVNYDINADLQGLSSVDIMEKIIMAAKEIGLKIILQYQRVHAGTVPEDGLWWDAKAPPEAFVKNWAFLAKRFKAHDNILGADLFNEVHDGCRGCPEGAPFWVENAGRYEEYNWRTWALKAADAIQAEQPQWIIFFQGMFTNYWRGGNVTALLSAPFKLKVANKMAFSAHEYGPYTFMQDYYKAKDFPGNLQGIFRANWGRVQETRIAPVYVGEFGTNYLNTTRRIDFIDRAVFRSLVAYMRRIKVSWTFGSWGPNNYTGGLLGENFKTVSTTKGNLLSSIIYHNFSPNPGFSS